MTLSHLAGHTIPTLTWGLSALLFVGSQHLLPESARDTVKVRLDDPLVTSQSQTSTKAKSGSQSKTQKLANPLNDLLEEAQRDIDRKQFEAALTPLQKVLAEEPDFAYG